MRKSTQANETADNRSAGVVTQRVLPGIGSGIPFIGGLLRLARFRSRRAVAGEDVGDAISPQERRPDHVSEMARSSMEAGLTGGVSLLFGEFRSRR